MTNKNRIWIELDKSKNKAHADEQCRLANKMLARLGDMAGREFFYSEHDRCYCYGGNMGYETLPDRGVWFNLDYLAGD